MGGLSCLHPCPPAWGLLLQTQHPHLGHSCAASGLLADTWQWLLVYLAQPWRLGTG